MSKKVIFFDIDGTLVHNHQPMSSKVVEGLKKARENGYLLFLCTGRNISSITSMMEYFDGAIASAGAYIEVNGEKIYESGFDYNEVKYVQSIFDQYDIMYNLEGNDCTYSSEGMLHQFFSLIHSDKTNSEIDRLIDELSQGQNLYSINDYNETSSLIKTIVYLGLKDNIKVPQQLLSPIHDFLTYSPFNETTVNGELMKKGIDKGFGVRKVMEYYALPIENSIGFGDSMNDLEMIKTCEIGIVMENGDEKIKQYATYVCKSVKEDGVYHEMKRLNII